MLSSLSATLGNAPWGTILLDVAKVLVAVITTFI